MKKVLIISSSPRKNSNSETLCKAFAEGAKEAGNEVEIVTLQTCWFLHCLFTITRCRASSKQCSIA